MRGTSRPSLVADIRDLFQARDTAIWILAALFFTGSIRRALSEQQIDFGPVWRASDAVLHGLPPYEAVVEGGDYVHTPGSTVLFIPFGLLSQNLGGMLMVLLGAAAMVIGLLAAGAATRTAPRIVALVALAFGMSLPVLRELLLANLDGVCVAPLGLALYWLQRDKRPALAGFMVGLALTIKPTILPLVLLPWALGSFRGTVYAAVFAGALNLLALPLLPEASRFFTAVVPFLLDGNTDGYNVSFKAALERAGAPGGLVVAARLLSVAMIVIGYLRFREQLRENPGALIALFVLGTVFVTSYFFGAYSVYLLLAVSVVPLFQRPGELAVLAFAAYLLLAPEVLRSGTLWLDTLLGFRYPAGAALLLGGLAWVLLRRTSEEGHPPPPRAWRSRERTPVSA